MEACESAQEPSPRLDGRGELDGLGEFNGAIAHELNDAIAHELNNIFGVIQNYSTLIGRVVHDRSVQEDLARIRAAAERGAELSGQLGTLARLSGQDLDD